MGSSFRLPARAKQHLISFSEQPFSFQLKLAHSYAPRADDIYEHLLEDVGAITHCTTPDRWIICGDLNTDAGALRSKAASLWHTDITKPNDALALIVSLTQATQVESNTGIAIF